MCKKIGYGSQREASGALYAIKNTSSRSHIPRRVYYCKDCKKYVLTSSKEVLKRK